MVGEKLVVLDLDGVLINSSAVNVRAFQHGLAMAGVAAPGDEAVRRLIGCPAVAMLEALGCPSAQAPDVYRRYVRPYYLEHFAPLASAYPGAVETLHELTERGYRLAACTSGTLDVQEPALRSLGLLDFFSRLQTACRSRYAKPHPAYLGEVLQAYGAPQEVWHVEDTEEGVRMGLANQAISVFAGYGYGRLKAVRPHYRVKRIGELLRCMDRHHRAKRMENRA